MSPKYDSAHQDSFSDVQGVRGLLGTLLSCTLVAFLRSENQLETGICKTQGCREPQV